jgi:nucleolar protein 15
MAEIKLSSRKTPAVKTTIPVVSKRTQSIVFFSGVPKQFSEREIRTFFGQFGKICKLRLSRSKKTAGSKGYGYIQFEFPEIAKIVSEATNNHIIAGKAIVVQHMDPESVWPELFKGHNRTFRDLRPSREAIRRKRHNKSTHETMSLSKIEKDSKRAAKLAEMGIEYEFTRKVAGEELKPVEEPTPTPTVEDAVPARPKRACRAAKKTH